MTDNPPTPDLRADVLREVADICDEAASTYAERGADDPNHAANTAASALFALMERFQRKADEAEYVATPCDPMVPCEDGGEPCHIHERLMAHSEGDHALCEPDCGVKPAAVPVPPTTHATDEERRQRYAAAIRETDGWVLDDGQHMIDAVMAVADAEQAELQTQNERMRHELEVMYGGAFDTLPTTNRAGLRDTITKALAMADGWQFTDGIDLYDLPDRELMRYRPGADAVLAVLPPPADRAAVLRETVEQLAQVPHTHVLTELRRLADEAQQQPAVPGRAADEEHDVTRRVPCSWVAVKSSHSPHDWEPQPGMAPAHCPGYRLPPMDPVHILGIEANEEPRR